MPLPRTNTLQMQDVVICGLVDDISIAETRTYTSPINGWVERFLVAKGGAHSTSGENWTLTVGSNLAEALNGTVDGSIRDVDAFEFPADKLEVAVGEAIVVANAGTPTGTDPVGYTIVIRRR